MSDANDHSAIFNRAKTVFGFKPFAAVQLVIETNRHRDDVKAALEAFVANGIMERIEGYPVQYRITE